MTVLGSALILVVVNSYVLQSELQRIGPTDKVKFLRVLGRSEYRKLGQREFRIDQNTLIVVWDLRWSKLPDKKQDEAISLVGRAWSVVGGGSTEFQIEETDTKVADYVDGKAVLLR